MADAPRPRVCRKLAADVAKEADEATSNLDYIDDNGISFPIILQPNSAPKTGVVQQRGCRGEPLAIRSMRVNDLSVEL